MKRTFYAYEPHNIGALKAKITFDDNLIVDYKSEDKDDDLITEFITKLYFISSKGYVKTEGEYLAGLRKKGAKK